MSNDLKSNVTKYEEWDYNIKVAGVKFRQIELDELYEQDWSSVPIRLEAEPTNHADPNAIKVFAGTKHIGYIPALVAPHLKELISGEHECALVYITGGENGKFRTAKIAIRRI